VIFTISIFRTFFWQWANIFNEQIKKVIIMLSRIFNLKRLFTNYVLFFIQMPFFNMPVYNTRTIPQSYFYLRQENFEHTSNIIEINVSQNHSSINIKSQWIPSISAHLISALKMWSKQIMNKKVILIKNRFQHLFKQIEIWL
jgi:hypothetical protein